MNVCRPVSANIRRHTGLAVIVAHILLPLSTTCPSGTEHAHTQAVRVRTIETQVLHNVLAIEAESGVVAISGSAPNGKPGFEALSKWGVKTILSVDGAIPDVERAAGLGMRYVHLPIGYHGISPTKRLELARVVRDLPGPIYVHCHHGKHRGPAALAAALVILGRLDNDEARRILVTAGTSPHYPGLYQAVRGCIPASDDQLASADATFPAKSSVNDVVQLMVQAEVAMGHLNLLSTTDWNPPQTHPDLVAIAEAGQLENLMRRLVNLSRETRRSSEFSAMAIRAWRASQELESSLATHSHRPEAGAWLANLQNTCNACHTSTRNIPRTKP